MTETSHSPRGTSQTSVPILNASLLSLLRQCVISRAPPYVTSLHVTLRSPHLINEVIAIGVARLL
jgi:hypothetical protein